jgi:hypothetical protein
VKGWRRGNDWHVANRRKMLKHHFIRAAAGQYRPDQRNRFEMRKNSELMGTMAMPLRRHG